MFSSTCVSRQPTNTDCLQRLCVRRWPRNVDGLPIAFAIRRVSCRLYRDCAWFKTDLDLLKHFIERFSKDLNKKARSALEDLRIATADADPREELLRRARQE